MTGKDCLGFNKMSDHISLTIKIVDKFDIFLTCYYIIICVQLLITIINLWRAPMIHNQITL